MGNPIYWTKKKSLIGNSLHILFGCPRAIGVRGKKRGHTKGRFNPGFIEPRGRGFSYPSSLRFPLYILKREKILGTCENGDTLKRGKVRKNGTLLPLLFPDSCCYFFCRSFGARFLFPDLFCFLRIFLGEEKGRRRQKKPLRGLTRLDALPTRARQASFQSLTPKVSTAFLVRVVGLFRRNVSFKETLKLSAEID